MNDETLPSGDKAEASRPGYEKVTGLDKETKACVRACEAEASAKTASDYQHVVWAYGVIWTVFAVYGVLLWVRSNRQRTEVADLARRLRDLE